MGQAASPLTRQTDWLVDLFMATAIQERIEVRTNGADAPPQKQTLEADPLREYVAGGPLFYLAEYIRSLPHHIDDITRQFGDDLYERMMLDAKVASCIETFKLSVLASGIRVLPARKKGEEGFDRAQRIADFCSRALDQMETPMEDVVYDMLDCIAFGNRIAEQNYHIPTRGPLSGKLVLKSIKPKPRRSTAYVTDSKNNVLGIMGIIPGEYAPLTVDSLMVMPEKLKNILPRRKFVIMTFRGQNGDPRGRSQLRAAYNSWWLKTQLWPEMMRHLAQFGSPKIIAILSEKATPIDKIDPETGEPETDASGFPKQISPTDAAISTLIQLRNGTAAAFPFGTTIMPLEAADAAGKPFEGAIDLFDRQIMDAILGQTLATSEGQHQARAAAETHRDILGLYTQQGRLCVSIAGRRDILRYLVEYNFGSSALPYTPYLALSETEQQDFHADATAVAALQTAGYLDPSQLPETDARLNLPVRSQEEVQARQDAAKAATEAVKAASDDSGNPPDNSEESTNK